MESRVKFLAAGALLAALAFSGCSVADEDRCVDGYYWAEEYLSCLPDPEGDTDTETGTDDPDAGPDDGGTELGLGEECSGDPDCASFEADYCITNPMAPDDPGYCTIESCVAADCPDGWQCCDCTGLGWVQACMDDANATTAAAYGCTCE